MAVERRATMQFVPRRSPRRSALIRPNKAKNRRFLILRNACSYDYVNGRSTPRRPSAVSAHRACSA